MRGNHILINLTKKEAMVTPFNHENLLSWVDCGQYPERAVAASHVVTSMMSTAPWFNNRIVLAGDDTEVYQAVSHYGVVAPFKRTPARYVVNTIKGEYIDMEPFAQGNGRTAKLLINPLPALVAVGSCDGSKDRLPGNLKDLAGSWSGDAVASFTKTEFDRFQKSYNKKVLEKLSKVCDDAKKVASVAEKMYLKDVGFSGYTIQPHEAAPSASVQASPAPATRGHRLNQVGGSIHLSNSTTFVITGKLDRVRAEYEAMIRRAGHYLANKVGYNVDYLVVGERPGSVKLKDAEQHGTKVITLQQLRTALGHP